MTPALIAASGAFVVVSTLRIYLALRRRSHRLVGRRGEDEFIVRERDGFRELVIASPTHEQVQSRQSLADTLSSGTSYVDGLHLGMLLDERPRRVLFLGGGACVGPRQFEAAYPDVHVDVVEREPIVIAAAERFFGLAPSPRLSIVVSDAREYLTSAATYDLVVVDTYDAYRMPTHLVTTEFFAEVRAALSPHGAVVLNLIGSLERELVPSILGSLAQAFGDGFEIAVFEAPDASGQDHPIRNFIVLVAESIPYAALAERAAAVTVAPTLPRILAQRRIVTVDPARALTDASVTGTWIPVTE